MKKPAFVAACALAFAVLLASPAGAASSLQPVVHSDFHHYTFALTWQPGMCAGDSGCLPDQPQTPLIGLHGLWASLPQSLIDAGVTPPQWWAKGCDYFDHSDAQPPLAAPLLARLAAVMPHFADPLLRHEYDKHVQCFQFDPTKFFTTELAMHDTVANGAFGQYLVAHVGQTVTHDQVMDAFHSVFDTKLNQSLALECDKNSAGTPILTQLWFTLRVDDLDDFPKPQSMIDSPMKQDNCPASFTIPAWPDTSTLRGVVILSRHGVRSALSSQRLDTYAAQKWPAWEVADGYLTPHGFQLIQYFGAYYRALYGGEGLFPKTGCLANAFLYANEIERTEETARALGEGLAPGCSLVVHTSTAKVDALFGALPTYGKADSKIAREALLGMFGGDLNALYARYAQPLATLETILGCDGKNCPLLSDKPQTVKTGTFSGLAYASGGLESGAAAVDTLDLQYDDGKDAGWGRVTPQKLLEIAPLLHLSFVVNRGSPYASGAEGSNFLFHFAATIDQVADGKKNSGTRAPLSALFIDIVGHDTTLFEMATNLRLSWLAQGYQVNELPPGGALIFEVRAPTGGGAAFVRTYFSAQSYQQMHDAVPLTLSSPPLRVPVFVPGCPSFDCPIATFDAVVRSHVNAKFVGPW